MTPIIYNIILPFGRFVCIMLFGMIFARKKYNPLPRKTINHERIHIAQAKDCGGYIPYYILYLYWWMRRGYRNSPFEREAYNNERNYEYLAAREKGAWKKYK